jgi:hypothetical protein
MITEQDLIHTPINIAMLFEEIDQPCEKLYKRLKDEMNQSTKQVQEWLISKGIIYNIGIRTFYCDSRHSLDVAMLSAHIDPTVWEELHKTFKFQTSLLVNGIPLTKIPDEQLPPALLTIKQSDATFNNNLAHNISLTLLKQNDEARFTT